jgi:pimeloyl-ACP methyl ester carboxylesterase
MTLPRKLLFLPGAMGNTRMWRRVSDQLDQLDQLGRRVFMGWPGFGGVPSDPSVRSFDDLVSRVVDELNEPVDILAQSMGGVVALHATLQRPQLVRRLVLAVTSGGVDVAAMGGSDWRAQLLSAMPDMPRWLIDYRGDLTDQLRGLHPPTLLLWGDADPISPVAVGEHLQQLLPHATLRVVQGADHDLVDTHAEQVVPYIHAHLWDRPLPR